MHLSIWSLRSSCPSLFQYFWASGFLFANFCHLCLSCFITMRVHCLCVIYFWLSEPCWLCNLDDIGIFISDWLSFTHKEKGYFLWLFLDIRKEFYEILALYWIWLRNNCMRIHHLSVWQWKEHFSPSLK